MTNSQVEDNKSGMEEDGEENENVCRTDPSSDKKLSVRFDTADEPAMKPCSHETHDEESNISSIQESGKETEEQIDGGTEKDDEKVSSRQTASYVHSSPELQ